MAAASKSTTRASSARSSWKPFSPYRGSGRLQLIDTVTVLPSGSVRISEDIAARLGTPSRVQLLTNGTGDQFALCAATERIGSAALSREGRRYEIRVRSLFTTLGRDASKLDWSIDLPHSWDDDLLVIDISAVPVIEDGAQ